MPQETPNPAAVSKLGKYELLQEFAGSGVASTWIARSPDEPGLFSILRLHQHIAKKVEVAEEFLREARQIRAFRHRNVIPLIETGVGDGEVFVVSEYVEGESLATLLAQARGDGLPLAVTLRISLDLLEGLSAAHTQKPDPLVHGELNPYHIIVGTDGCTRISSFGIARSLAKIGTHGVMRPDRLSYGAPERVRAMAAAGSATTAEGPIDPRSDLFSAAVIVWECIAKQRLFASKMESAVIQKVLSAPVPSLSSLPDLTVAEDVSEIVQKALERDLARRCPSADEFIMSLEGAGPDVIASQEQVAALLDKLVGKQIAARRKEIEEGGTAKKLSDRVGPAASSLRSRFPTVMGLAPGSSRSAGPPPRPSRPELLLRSAGAQGAARPGGASTPSPLPPPVKEAPAAEAPTAEAPTAEAAATEVAATEVAAKEVAATEVAATEVAATEVAATEVAATEVAATEVAATEAPANEVTGSQPEISASAPSAALTSPSAGGGAVSPPPLLPPRAAMRSPADLGTSRTPLGPPVAAGKPAPKLLGDVRKPPPPPPRQAGAPAKLPPPARVPVPTPAAGVSLKRITFPPAPPRLLQKAGSGAAEPSAADMPPAAAAPAPVEIPAAEDKRRIESIPPTKILGPAAARPAESSEEGSAPSSPSAPASLTPRGRASTAVGNVRPFSTLGRYEILMPVAKGGMAVVWAARLQGSRGFQKIVAIKTMLPDVSDDPDFEAMFLDEARVAARIRHPNVVEILDLGEASDVVYIAMEWIEGTTLSALMKAAKSAGGIPLPLAIRIASQICGGLHGAHELRDDRGALVDLVHRDISPVNILVSTGGFAKVADFGVAKSKARQHVTRAGGIIKGKTAYLSPEQFKGRPLDRRSDLFSLGALLYVMITGAHPFRGETDVQTLENIAAKDPKPLRELVPSLNPEVERIVLKALEKDRDKRFSTAAEMQRALELVAPSLGPVTTNEDVAEFVRKTVGDVLEKNAAELRKAIAVADGTSEAQPSPPPASPEDAAPVSAAPVSEVPVSIDEEVLEEVADDAPKKASAEGAAPARKAAAASKPPGDVDKPKAARSPGDSSPEAAEQGHVAAAAPVEAAESAPAKGKPIATVQKSRTLQLVIGGIAAAAIFVLWLSLGGTDSTEPTGVPPSRQGTPPEKAVVAPAPTRTEPPESLSPQPPPVEAQPAASATPEPAGSSAPAPVIAAVEPVSPPATTTAKPKSPSTSTTRAPSATKAPAPSTAARPTKQPAPTIKPTKKYTPKGI